jgi:phage terminase large subunit-like protein
MTEEEWMELYLKTPYLQFEARPDTETDQMTSFLNDYFEGGKIILGGTGSSKSYTSCWALAREIYRNKAPAPNTPIWVISQTLDMSGSLYTQALSRFITPDQWENIRWRKTGLQPELIQLKKDEYGNNFNLHFFSYEQGRKALQSSNVWMAYLDEQAPSEIIEEVWGRLRTWQHNNMLIYSLTPLDPDPWLSDLHDRRNDPEISNLWRFYNLDTMANPHISTDWKKNYLDSLPPDVRLTRQYGQFSSYRGAVYPEFTNDLVINPIELEGQRFIGIDFGFHHPAAIWMIMKDDNFYVVDDMQLHDTMPEVFAQKIKEKCHDHRWKVIVDTEDPISIRYLNAAGIVTSGARKNVIDGITNVKSLMFCKKFFVFKSCRETIKQLKSYIWKEGIEGKNPSDAPDEPKKLNDHLCDCLRYVTYTNLKSQIKPWEAAVGSKPIQLVPNNMKNPLFRR